MKNQEIFLFLGWKERMNDLEDKPALQEKQLNNHCPDAHMYDVFSETQTYNPWECEIDRTLPSW